METKDNWLWDEIIYLFVLIGEGRIISKDGRLSMRDIHECVAHKGISYYRVRKVVRCMLNVGVLSRKSHRLVKNA